MGVENDNADLTDGLAPQVIVVGAGSAGLIAAIAAAENGAHVTILEAGEPSDAGGNATYSGGLFLFSHRGVTDLVAVVPGLQGRLRAEPYPRQEYSDALVQMSGGRADPGLVHVLVHESYEAIEWLVEQGVQFTVASAVYGPYDDDGVTVIPAGPALEARGAGRGLVLSLLDAVRRHGVEVVYETQVTELEVVADRVVGVVDDVGRRHRCDAVVLCPGGFEASEDLRRKYLGETWGHVKIRGTRHNTGRLLESSLRRGARVAGDLAACHSISVDAAAESPPSATVPTPARISRGFRYGIVVNSRGVRFFDEGADMWTRIYSKMGRAILEQPGAVAYHVFDGKVRSEVLTAMPGATHFEADSLTDLANQVGLVPGRLEATIGEFNRSIDDGVDLNYQRLDGRGTRGLVVPKSNWADKIDTAPYLVFPAACGITFTHGGVATAIDGSLLFTDDTIALRGVYAAGEITGGLFFGNYPGGSSLMRSAVFGRRAGAAAATYARAGEAGS